MTDPFAKYGGRALGAAPDKESPGSDSDPFARYGGRALSAPEPTNASDPAQDPFARYGGTSLDSPSETMGPRPAAESADIEALAASGPEGLVTRPDLEFLAKKHGVPEEFLRDSVGWLSGVLDPRERRGAEHVTESLKSTAGSAAEGLLFGLPQKLWTRLAIPEENARRAVDDLRRLIDERKTAGQMIGEVALGFVAPAGVAAKIGRAGSSARAAAGAAEATALGASAGYAHSGEDDELLSTLVGGGVGLIFGSAPAALGFVRSKFAPRVSEDVVQVTTEAVQDSVAVARRAFEENADAEKLLAQAVLESPAVREAARSGDVYQFLDSVPEEAVPALAQLADGTPRMRARTLEAIGEDAARAWGVVRSTVAEFDARIGVGARRGGVRDVVEQEGLEEVVSRFRGMREAHYLRAAVDEIPDAEVGKPGAIRKFAAWFADARYTLDAVDRRVGTRLVPTLDRLSGQYNKFRGDMVWASSVQKGLNRALLRVERQGAADGSGLDIYSALDRLGSEKSGRYTDEQKQAIRMWREGFEALRQHAKKLGLPIKKWEGGYVPKMTVDPPDYVQRMEVAGGRLGLDLNRTSRGTYVGLDDDALQAALDRAQAGETLAREFVQGMKMLRGGDVTSLTEAREALNSMLDMSRVGSRLETMARAALSRESAEGIPPWLLERDVSKLFARWAHNTFRHARMRRGLDELRTVAEAVQDKSPEASGYVTRLIEDLVGVREGSAAASQGEFLRRIQMQLGRAARRAGEDTVTGKTYLQLAKLPDAISFFSSQLYSYGLGMRVDKFLENLTQPLTLTIPSIGIRNGGYVLKGAADMIAHFARGMKRSEISLKGFLEREGLMPPDQPFESARWLREGLERSPLKRKGQAVMEASSRAAMLLYQQSDIMTRGISYHAARRVARDMLEGRIDARGILEEMGPGYARTIQEKLSRGEDVTREVAAWMNAHTMFNYNRVSMSEYGRFMGSLFSTFSKWPTSILGDLANRADRVSRGDARLAPELMRTGVKYLAPLLVLKGIGSLVQEELDANPQAQMVFGKDPSKPAPIRSATGGLVSAPLPRAASEVVAAGIERDPAAAGAAALRNMLPFTPGGVWIRFLYKDLPAWRGDRPERGSPGQLLFEDLGVADGDDG